MKLTSTLFRSIYAGAIYFALVFALGFVLGAIRYLLVIPRVGELAGVLIEIPIILTLAWFAAGWVIARLQIPRNLVPRLMMSFCALMLLLMAESFLSIWIMGNSLEAHLESYRTPHGALGLSGQLAFGIFPLLRLLTRSEHSGRG